MIELWNFITKDETQTIAQKDNNTVEDYFYETKRDLFVFQVKDQSKSGLIFDKEHEDNLKLMKEFTDWFDSNNITYKLTGPAGLLVGWLGHYYVEFDGMEDPKLIEYCRVFENEDGKSKEPDKYQMYSMSYDKWVTEGGLESYEDRKNDPDWEY